MEALLVRHAKAQGTPLNEVEGPALSEIGIAQARQLSGELVSRGINLATVQVAVSALLRTRQTALEAGLINSTVCPLLNEVNTSNPVQTSRLLEQRMLPDEALAAADVLLNDPPPQQIWLTHGLVMMGLIERLRMDSPGPYVPDYCQIVSIQF